MDRGVKEFEDLKAYLSPPPVLSKLEKDEVLYIYYAMANREVSSMLIRDDELKVLRPIYYARKALVGVELRYSKLEKTAYALFITAKKLATYF